MNRWGVRMGRLLLALLLITVLLSSSALALPKVPIHGFKVEKRMHLVAGWKKLQGEVESIESPVLHIYFKVVEHLRGGIRLPWPWLYKYIHRPVWELLYAVSYTHLTLPTKA